jgi:tRNA dimethylallyltransferase
LAVAEKENGKLIVIVGPTAVGKTALAIYLARQWGTEIISADSRQLYRELTVGTAKPSPEELRKVPHHFINTHSITAPYNAARFGDEAFAVATDLLKQHERVVVCGGSGLYVKALLEGFDDVPEVPEDVRLRLQQLFATQGSEWLQRQVQQLDPVYYARADVHNSQRMLRALEVFHATGKSITEFQVSKKRELPFGVCKIGLELDRDALYQRIDARMDAMVASGLFEEAEGLYPYRHHNALQTVGYQEIFGYMNGAYSREEAIRLLKRNSRRYAKRQLTWFKRDEEIKWFAPDQTEAIISFLSGQ